MQGKCHYGCTFHTLIRCLMWGELSKQTLRVEEQVMCRLGRALQSTTEKQKHVGLLATYIPISCEISECTGRMFNAGSTIWQILIENNRNSVQGIQNLTSAFPGTVKCWGNFTPLTISCIYNINIRVFYFNAVSLYVFFYCIPVNTRHHAALESLCWHCLGLWGHLWDHRKGRHEVAAGQSAHSALTQASSRRRNFQSDHVKQANYSPNEVERSPEVVRAILLQGKRWNVEKCSINSPVFHA